MAFDYACNTLAIVSAWMVRIPHTGEPIGGRTGIPMLMPTPTPEAYPPVVSQPSQQLSIQPPASPPSWYYCDKPQGYYPYVQACPGGWRAVAPTPP